MLHVEYVKVYISIFGSMLYRVYHKYPYERPDKIVGNYHKNNSFINFYNMALILAKDVVAYLVSLSIFSKEDYFGEKEVKSLVYV